MTSKSPFDDDITDPNEFEAALGQLLRTALENGIDLKGSWEFRSDGDGNDFEIIVYELDDGD